MRWIKASERLPDQPEFWLANNKTQEGKIVHCKVNGDTGIGYFWKRDGIMMFSFSYNERKYEKDIGYYWEINDNGFVDYANFDKIEWLDESQDTDKRYTVGELLKLAENYMPTSVVKDFINSLTSIK